MNNLPDFLHERASEIVTMEADCADKKRLWAVVLGLRPYRDGGHVVCFNINRPASCCLWVRENTC
jgi:hypothetical protein